MVFLLREGRRSESSKLESAVSEAARYLVGQVRDNGYISASSRYGFYDMHWIRDASFVSMGLLDAAAFLKSRDSRLAEEAREAAGRINSFHCKIIDSNAGRIEKALGISLEDPEFLMLQNHIQARVGPGGGFYKGRVLDAHGNSFDVDDTRELYSQNSWQRQYDALPLMLIALEKEARLFGIDKKKRSLLEKRGEVIAKYLGKVYVTPCASIWEMDSDKLHPFTIGAIERAFDSLRYFSEIGAVSMGKEGIAAIAEGLYRNGSGGGPAEFLKRHIYGDVVYRLREPFREADLQSGVDLSAIYLFTRFGMGEKLGAEVERKTMEKVEKDRFRGNALGTRYDGDVYFKGGRWILSVELAIYAAQRGEIQKASEIVSYVMDKYGNDLPEQEIVDPESQRSIEGEMDLRRNGGNTIQKLAWSYASMITTISTIFQGLEGRREAFIEIARQA